jgi:hypothetical protein
MKGLLEYAKENFDIDESKDYYMGELCSGCGTVWLCERVDPKTNQGRDTAWDTYKGAKAVEAEEIGSSRAG